MSDPQKRPDEKVEIRPIAAIETLPLRSAVLRPGHPIEEAIFAGDDDPDTLHLGAFADGEIVGVLSLYRRPLPVTVISESDVSAAVIWQLRGMAVDSAAQGRGYGRALLNACRHHVAQRGGRLLWCNARASAAGFYRAGGFETLSDEFEIPGVGPHFVMAVSINHRSDRSLQPMP